MRPALIVYCDEIQPSEGIMVHWWQMGHAMLRLRFAIKEMESSTNNINDLQGIYRFQYQIENYYSRIYELRERLFALVAALVKQKKVKDKLLDSSKQKEVFMALSGLDKDCVTSLRKIIKLLNKEIAIRNIHTHRVFLRLGFYIGTQFTDIEDIWWEYDEDDEYRGKMFKKLNRVAAPFIKDYIAKTEAIIMEVERFMRSLLPYLRNVDV